MSKVDPKSEELMKSIDQVIDDVLSEDEGSEEIEKSKPSIEHNPANGGDDKIKSGTPLTENQKAEEAKKSQEEDEKEKDEESKDEEKNESQEVEKSEEASDDKAEDKQAEKKLKKSLEELAEILDEEELELVKAWRESEQEDAQESKIDTQEIVKSITQAVSAEMEDIKKSLSQKDELIKSLTEQINKISSEPAYEKKAIDSLESLEKSTASRSQTLNKSQVLDTMLDLQQSGKGVTSLHIAEFESTGNISNPQVRNLVMSESKKRFAN